MSASRSKRGFALIISLVLMGMLVLLVLGLGALTRTETSASEQQRLQKEAQGNALIALKAALGQLQSNAGADRRTTAMLDITDSYTDYRRYWTGVWQNTGTHTAATNLTTYTPARIAVLVSGDDPLNAPTTDAQTIELVGEYSADTERVRAPRVELKNSSNAIIGNYAWWVGDEGVKANLSVRDRSAEADNVSGVGVVTAEERQAQRMGAAPRYGIELMGFNSDNDPLDSYYPTQTSDGVENLDVIFNSQQFMLVRADGQPINEGTAASRREFLRLRFHDVTVFSAGLLADQRRGGLREDLTYLLGPNNTAPLGDTLWADGATDGPSWQLLKDYASLAGSTSQMPRASTADQVGIHPVLTQWYLNFSLSVTANNKLRLQMYPVFVLHNPYNITLSAADYRLTVDASNLMLAATYTAGSSTEEFGAAFGEKPSGAPAIASEVTEVFGENGLIRFHITGLSIAPGEAVLLSLKDAGGYYAGLVDSAAASAGSSPSEDGSELAINNIAVSGMPHYAELELNLLLSGAPTGDLEWHFTESSNQSVGIYLTSSSGQGYQSLLGLGYTDPAGKVMQQPVVDASPIGAPQGGFSYILRTLSSQTQFDVEPLPIYANFNPRAQTLSPNLFAGELRVGGNIKRIPPLASIDSGSARPFVGPHSDATYEGVDGINTAVLFDGNRHGLISLGQLQHLDMSGEGSATRSEAPSLAFGNSFADPRVPRNLSIDDDFFDISYRANEALWDGYFFSTVPQDSASERFPLQNPILANSRLRPIDHALTATASYRNSAHAAAEHLWIEGAFNVNSTSDQAWMALLASLRDLAGSTDGNNNIQPRFVNSIIGAGGVSVEEAPAGLSAGAWNSIRKLTDAQIEDFAKKMVEQVRERGPFLSLADFANRELNTGVNSFAGALQAALDSTQPAINTAMRAAPLPIVDAGSALFPGYSQNDNYARYDDSGSEKIDYLRGAPGLLTQADILTLVGPVLSARSDTFVIRAYGDVTKVGDGANVTARAWCEAIVQRYPERLDGNYGQIAADAADMGRRFRIIHFRWLGSDEI